MPDVLSDQEAWSQPEKELSDNEAWTPAPVQIAHKEGAAKTILHAFGQGFNEATDNYEQLGITPGGDFEKTLQNAGLMNDYVNDEKSWRKSVTGGILTSSAAALDAAMRTGGGLITGPLMAGGGALERMGVTGATHASGELSDYFLQSPVLAEGAHSVKLPEFTHKDLLSAQANGVLDEKTYFGGEPTPAQEIAQRAATEAIPDTESASPQPPPPDIHAMARNVAPEAFASYDRLTNTRDTLRSQLSDLQGQRTADLDAQIKAVEDAKQGGYGKLQALKAKRDAISGQDTPEMAEIRQKLQETDYQMRDLAPQVSAAYRTAGEFMPEEKPENAPENADLGEKPAENEPDSAPQKPIEEQKQAIATDFVQRAKAVGVPDELAEAHGQIEAAHYATLAEIYPKFSAEEWYSRERSTLQNKAAAQSHELAQFENEHQEAYARKVGSLSNIEGRIAELDPAKDADKIADLSRERDLTQKWITENPQELFQGAKRGSYDPISNTIKMFNADFSTLAHEKGHEFTLRLIRLAKEADAPAQMKLDAKALKDWAKFPDADPMSSKEAERAWRKANEKLARGYERFLMEGVAPSKALARVFAKFQQWMNAIYQTVERLRAPISDDVRDAFHRMLSANPEKTVIAPDHEPGKMMADIHEADAAHTPPEKAAAVADNVRNEMKAVAKQDKEASDAIRAAETGGGVDNSGQPQPTGEPEPAAGASSAVAPPEPVGTGGGEAAGEGAPARQEPAAAGGPGPISGQEPVAGEPRSTIQPGAESGEPAVTEPNPAKLGFDAGKSPDNKPASDPDAVLRRAKSDLIDKAGNIRLENLTQNEDVRDVMRQAARDSNDFDAARRGKVSDLEVSRLADAMGVAERELNIQKLRQTSVEDGIPLAVRIKVGRQMLVQSAEAARDAMIKAATGSEADLIALADVRRRHLMIAETVAGITEEWGRAGRSFRDISKEQMGETQNITDLFQRMTGKTPKQMLDMAKKGSALDTGGQISKFMQDSKKASFGDMVLEWWISGKISGAATHTTYMIGNQLLTLWKAVPETAVASALGKLRPKEAGEHVQIGEVGAKLKAMADSLPTAISAAGKAAKTGVTTLLPGEEAVSMPFQPGSERTVPGRIGNENISWNQLGSDAFGAMKGMRDALMGIGDLIKSGGVDESPAFAVKPTSRGAIPNFEVKGVPVPLGDIIRSPGRAVAAIHSLFRTMNFSMEKAGLAYRQAFEEAKDGKYSDEAFASRIGELVTNPSEEQMLRARGEATETTLMGQGGEFTRALGRLTNASVRLPGLGETRLLKFIDPFVHISSNIIDQALIQRTPIGLLSADIRADLSGVNGTVARDFAQSRMLVGTALGISIGGLTAQGVVSGSGPSDQRKASIWRQLGNQAHSIKVGGAWYDIHRLGPIGMIIGIAADMYQVAHEATKDDMSQITALFMHAVAQNVIDESWMRGPSEILKVLDDGDRYGKQWVQNFAASFVPFDVGLGQAARAVDPYTRQARTVMDAIRAKIPFVSEGLLPKRNIWGEPMPNKDVFGLPGFSAIYKTPESIDPVERTMLQLGYYPSQPERKINGVPLTDKQFDDYSLVAGQLAKSRLDMLVGMRGFASKSDETKLEMMKATVDEARAKARAAIMMRNPDIMKQARDNMRLRQGRGSASK